jgi:hypothetical protein
MYIAYLLILELARVLFKFKASGIVFRFSATFDTVSRVPSYDTVELLKNRRLMLPYSHINYDLAFDFQSSDKYFNNKPTNIMT